MFVTGRGSREYVASYRYLAQIDSVFLLAARSRRESGFTRGSGAGTAVHGFMSQAIASGAWSKNFSALQIDAVRALDARASVARW